MTRMFIRTTFGVFVSIAGYHCGQSSAFAQAPTINHIAVCSSFQNSSSLLLDLTVIPYSLSVIKNKPFIGEAIIISTWKNVDGKVGKNEQSISISRDSFGRIREAPITAGHENHDLPSIILNPVEHTVTVLSPVEMRATVSPFDTVPEIPTVSSPPGPPEDGNTVQQSQSQLHNIGSGASDAIRKVVTKKFGSDLLLEGSSVQVSCNGTSPFVVRITQWLSPEFDFIFSAKAESSSGLSREVTLTRFENKEPAFDLFQIPSSYKTVTHDGASK